MLLFIIDAVDDTVGAPTGTVPVSQRRMQAFADPVRILSQWSDDEFVGGKCHRFGELFSQLPSGGRRDDQRVPGAGHTLARAAGGHRRRQLGFGFP